MARPRFLRLLFLLIAFLLVWAFFAVVRPRTVDRDGYTALSNTPDGKWHDPNDDMINEPPGPLQRTTTKGYSPNSPASQRINATILSLVRNSELEDLLPTIRDLERTFNRKFNYPWTFFNDEPFTARFKAVVSKEIRGTVNFHQIPEEHWATPPWINSELYAESVHLLKEKGVQYADKISYRHMCRWNSGLFAWHPALKHMQYYWRVEPHVRFFCDIDYDVFRFMQDHNKTYGFTLNLYDSPDSIPSLWQETQRFLAADENKDAVHKNSARAWLEDAEQRPEHNRRAGGYSTCHFWSNFEIGSLDFWRSDLYTRYFNYLDRAGGFFYERWGDAPVHSIALGLFQDMDRIHWFRDIGYQHIPFFNCPTRPPGKCRGCKEGLLTDGEKFLYKEDCRPSWLRHVGLGVWDEERKKKEEAREEELERLREEEDEMERERARRKGRKLVVNDDAAYSKDAKIGVHENKEVKDMKEVVGKKKKLEEEEKEEEEEEEEDEARRIKKFKEKFGDRD